MNTSARNCALYPLADIRDIEQAAQSILPAGTLMRRAGSAAATYALSLLPPTKQSVLVLAGSGNNGGDALEVGYLLAEQGLEVTILFTAVSQQLPDDAHAAWIRASHSPARILTSGENLAPLFPAIGLIVDGLFGIGLSRAITGELAELIQIINAASKQFSISVLALDTPSGLNAETGQTSCNGDAQIAICATHTITFIVNKAGLHTADGRDFAGKVLVEPLGIADEALPISHAHLSQMSLVKSKLPARKQNSHKGSFGDVMIIGGAQGMCGAPVMAARAALHTGAGRVHVAFVAEHPPYDANYPELMFRAIADADWHNQTLVVGPGLGQSAQAKTILQQAIHHPHPIVLDADALNLLATDVSLHAAVHARTAATLLTPHPLEAARLLGLSAAQIQSRRVEYARLLAQQFNAVVVLKGSGSIIACADGEVIINTTGNPALAVGGTGDILAGMCGALLAQKLSAFDAAQLAVFAHGLAADNLVKQGTGPVGISAGELLPAIRQVINSLSE